jgi:hypothetical protein
MFRDKERRLALQRVETAMGREFHHRADEKPCRSCKRAAKVAVAMLWEEARAAYGMGLGDGERQTAGGVVISQRRQCEHGCLEQPVEGAS